MNNTGMTTSEGQLTMSDIKTGDRVRLDDVEATIRYVSSTGTTADVTLHFSDGREKLVGSMPLTDVTKIESPIAVGDVMSWNDTLDLPLGSIVAPRSSGFAERVVIPAGLLNVDTGVTIARADVCNSIKNVVVKYLGGQS